MVPSDLLESTIEALPSALIRHGVSGHCDAFALALMETLEAYGVSKDGIALVVIERTRTNAEGQVLDENPLSHVVLETPGGCWDVCGSRADERWEEEWIQPSKEDDDDEDEELASDSFNYREVTVDELVALRLERDQRIPDPEIQALFGAHLRAHLPPPGEGNPKRRVKRP